MQYCGAPHCPKLVTHGRCMDHARVQTRQADAFRGTAQERGYDHSWHLLSEAFRRAHPVCGERHDGTMDRVNSRCAKRGIDVLAQCVDHTIPKAQGGTNDERNLMSACFSCNAWKAKTLEKMSA